MYVLRVIPAARHALEEAVPIVCLAFFLITISLPLIRALALAAKAPTLLLLALPQNVSVVTQLVRLALVLLAPSVYPALEAYS